MTDAHRALLRDRSADPPRNGGLLVWGIVGVGAQVAFMAGWVVAELWQGSRYSPVTDTISDMQAATAPHAWFAITCFAVGGLGTFGFAIFGLRPALARAGKTAAFAPWMLGFSALALGNSFPLIPCRLADLGCTPHQQLMSPGGLTDAIVASIAFLVLAFTPSPLWRRLATLPEWRRMKPVMVVARVAGPAGFILLSVFSTLGFAEGLFERILAATCSLWISALAINAIIVSGCPVATVE